MVAVEPVFVVLVIAGVVALIVWGAIAAAKRRKELAAWAAANGLQYRDTKDGSFDERFPFSCLKQGTGRYAYNLMDGTRDERGILAFDYHYETHSTDSKGRRQTHHHHFSAVILDTRLPLKPLFMRPEGFFDKVTEFFGYDDIDFESAEFSRKFYVKSPDKRWAFDVIHQETMEFLLGAPRFHLEMNGPHVMAWRGSTFRPPEFGDALTVAGGVVERLPRSLLKEWGKG